MNEALADEAEQERTKAEAGLFDPTKERLQSVQKETLALYSWLRRKMDWAMSGERRSGTVAAMLSGAAGAEDSAADGVSYVPGRWLLPWVGWDELISAWLELGPSETRVSTTESSLAFPKGPHFPSLVDVTLNLVLGLPPLT